MSIDTMSDWSPKVAREVLSWEEERVNKGETPWPQYDSPLSNYDDAFKDVSPKGGIKRILTELAREQNKQELSVMDIAGQGTPYLECSDVGVTNITAVTLGDFRQEERKKLEESKGLTLIPGNIFDPQIRKLVFQKKYDLVSFRPSGGRHLFNSPKIYFDLFDFAYSALSDSGVLLMEVPEKLPIEWGTMWVEELSQLQGLEVKFSSPRRDEQSHLLVRKKLNGPSNISSILSTSKPSKTHHFRVDTLTWK